MRNDGPLCETRRFVMADGVSLVADVWGDPGNRPVLLSHGGGQTRHSWKLAGERLAGAGWHVVAYDHRGHGESDWSPDGHYSADLFASDQRAIAAQLGAPPVLVGASLGGIAGMLGQGGASSQIYSAVVLVDITPQMNHQAGIRILEFMSRSLSEGFATLEEAADVVAAYTGRKRRAHPAGLRKNLRVGEDGRYRWHWDPNFVRLRFDEAASPERLLAGARAITVPLLLVRGHQSDIVTEEIAREFLELVPQAEYVDVRDAAHMVVGDQNDVFFQEVQRFLDRLH